MECSFQQNLTSLAPQKLQCCFCASQHRDQLFKYGFIQTCQTFRKIGPKFFCVPVLPPLHSDANRSLCLGRTAAVWNQVKTLVPQKKVSHLRCPDRACLGGISHGKFSQLSHPGIYLQRIIDVNVLWIYRTSELSISSLLLWPSLQRINVRHLVMAL